MDSNYTKKIFSLKKYIFIFLVVCIVAGLGVTYAYFTYEVEKENVIVGNVVGMNADLDVELVIGNTTDEMVPLKGEALNNAINGNGSSNGPCIDSAGKLSCQIYKITLTNVGDEIKHINGTVELYPKTGTNNVYKNLMWRELESTTTVNEEDYFHTMEKSRLETDFELNPNETKTWYIAVWINEIEEDQTLTDKGNFGGTVSFETFEVQTNEFTERILKPNANSDATLDFSLTSEDENTNGIYLRSGTENDTYPIYYYRGAVDNNLIFAGFCWKVVRTTDTGGLKLLYNGVADGTNCDNTGADTLVGTKSFNSPDTVLRAAGFMYSSTYARTTKTMTSLGEIYYGNDIEYENGVYTLKDTISSSSWTDIYNGGLNNNHYTCFSANSTCSKVNYIYYTTNKVAYYITLEKGKTVERAIVEMLGADDSRILKYNTTNSTVKGNSSISGTIDYWYHTNIENTEYEDYLEDTVWCNDRRINNIAGWDKNGGDTTTTLLFESFNRSYYVNKPELDCARNVDSFTVDKEHGNGNLIYPIGLITPDELKLAGGKGSTTNSTYYLNNGTVYWIAAPNNFYTSRIVQQFVTAQGHLNGSYANSPNIGVRPAISLKPGFKLEDGTGTTTDPYIIS